MKLIYLSIIVSFFLVGLRCGCRCSNDSSSYYKYKEKQERRAERQARALERERIERETTRVHHSPSPEYLEKYQDAKTIHHNRKMEDLKRTMKAEQASNRYTGP